MHYTNFCGCKQAFYSLHSLPRFPLTCALYFLYLLGTDDLIFKGTAHDISASVKVEDRVVGSDVIEGNLQARYTSEGDRLRRQGKAPEFSLGAGCKPGSRFGPSLFDCLWRRSR
ncbi:MAG: hypothetical protein ACI8P9_002791 [Parasphingorhabdus sp.]|jgi:hypothetical protein